MHHSSPDPILVPVPTKQSRGVRRGGPASSQGTPPIESEDLESKIRQRIRSDHLSETELAQLVTRDCMIGVAVPQYHPG